ncbi:TonB-dependent receptor [Marivirga harenae]|uniref:TonB-dependent receptor domain-containing protein n=1 Tax=Marivirga harenae TaxID=2010992 RepID=UPI0026DFB61B|nr:TonB-dependent receptor [Marivirga harenae]WKV11556.1 TonB-dependent receptor [Marivirga harenae]|tara:strand:- start:41252 stop:43702 length:2451 start_codon:yes stop_codon:yes gene_type:complete
MQNVRNNTLKLFILILISLGSHSAWAQTTSVSGKLVDAKTKEPLAYANVSVLDANDEIVTGTVTPESGVFQFQVESGEYNLRIQFISYQTINRKLVANTSTIDFGTIELSEDVNQLSEVEVVARRPQMEMKLDKRVFNVGEDLSNIGSNAESLLDNLPSVTVDIEGNVSLRGSGNVRILIDGRPSGLVGISGGSALRQIQADMIERVEVITNPSARYEAEGNAGIINIIMKKEKKGGFNGSVSTNLGYPYIGGINSNLNYRKGSLNLFGAYGITYRENFGGGYIDQEFTPEDTTYSTYVDRQRERSGISQNARFGLDYSFDESTTVTGSFLYRISDENNLSNNFYDDYDGIDRSTRELVRRSVRIQDEKEDEEVLEYELNFTKTFGGNDEHKLTADIQYRNNTETEDSDLRNERFVISQNQFVDSIQQRSLINEFSENILLQANYVKPIGENRSFEAGWRSTLRTITNEYEVTQEVEGQEADSILSDFTNDFIYNEDVHALYAIYNSELNKFTYQIGLRAELTDISTRLKSPVDTTNARDYLNLFPSVFMTYEFNKLHSLQASYSRRFDRPGFRSLNPFSNFNDDRNIRIGNPNLNPEFTDSYEVGLVNNFSDATLYSGLYYRRTTGVTERINTVIDGITYAQPQNLAERNSIGIENNYSHDLNDWWRLNGNLNVFYSETYGVVNEQVFSAETFTASGRATSQMSFSNDFNMQLSAFYRAPQQTTQGTRKAFYMVDLGFSKEVLNNKGTLALNVRDLLNSRKWRTTTVGEDFFYDSEFQWRTTTVTLSFDYRINSNKKKKEGNREGGEFEGGGDEY